MLGNVEEAIMANYKKALERGDLVQAQRAIDLASKLREAIESTGFEDYTKLEETPRIHGLSMFKRVKYTYNLNQGTIVMFNQLIALTDIENKFFSLLSQNETTFDSLKIVKKEQIKNFVWPGKNVTNSAVRILIKRLRKKIEPNPYSPEILVNFSRKGYVFLGEATSI